MDNNQNNTNVPVPPQTSVPEPVKPATSASPSNAFGPAIKKEEKPVVENPLKKINTGIINVDEILKEYIGPNYSKFIARPFNFAAFFFTALYYFYRKMTLYGIIIIILSSVIAYFLPDKLYALLIINVLCGFLTNKLYGHFALKKINKALVKYAGNGKEYIKGACSVLGGRSLRRVFNTIVWLMIASIPVGIIISLFMYSTEFKNYIKNFDFSKINFNFIKLPSIEVENKFDGYIIVDKTDEVLSKFDVDTPSVFTPTENNNKYELEYSFKSNTRDKSTCSFSFKAISGYSNAKNLINGMHEYYKDKNPSEVKDTMINRIYWSTFDYKTEDANIYYYACNKGNKVYLYIYYDEINSTVSCHDYRGIILNDIVLKEN